MLIWGFEQYWWCLGKKLEPAIIMQIWKSHQIYRSNLKKRHCLLDYSLCHAFFVLQKLLYVVTVEL